MEASRGGAGGGVEESFGGEGVSGGDLTTRRRRGGMAATAAARGGDRGRSGRRMVFTSTSLEGGNVFALQNTNAPWRLESGMSFSSLGNFNVHLQVATLKTKTELHSFT